MSFSHQKQHIIWYHTKNHNGPFGFMAGTETRFSWYYILQIYTKENTKEILQYFVYDKYQELLYQIMDVYTKNYWYYKGGV